MCVSPTFASPIEKAATSTHRRICREIIGNTEGNAKTVDSFWHCKWTNSVSNQPQNEKADRRSGRRRIFKMVDHFETSMKSSLHLKMTNFSNPSRWAISLSRKILRGPYSPQRVENQNRRHEKLNSKYLRKIFFLEFAGSEAAILSYIFFACVTGSIKR